MIEPRNPFRMQASEQIESDITFLRLFGPGALESLPKEDLWNRTIVIRSSPGGGKTSLLRLMTPGALLTLQKHRGLDEFKELYHSMKNLGAIDGDGPRVLGVLLSCSKNFDSLEDIEINDQYRRRLLFSLLDSRIILAALRNIMDLKRLEYPTDLDKVTLNLPPETVLPQGVPILRNGEDMYAWACETERRVCEIIDGFGDIPPDSLYGNSSLVSPFILNPNYLVCNEQPVAPRVVLMLDDCHKLTRRQRTSLSSVIEVRPPVGIWIAERLEALSKEELLSPGAMHGRDVFFVELEETWRQSRGKKFEKMALNIADKRAQFASNVDIQSFSACLEDVLEIDQWKKKVDDALSAISDRVKRRIESIRKYDDWIYKQGRIDETALEKAIAWRTLEILIERDLRKDQKTLTEFSPQMDIRYGVDELERRDDSNVKAAAELALSSEYKLPYYFGAARLANLASSNVEQFLWLAGCLFEEVLSQYLIDPQSQVSSRREQEIIEGAVKERWDNIPYRVRYGRDVMRFLESIGKYSRWETVKPNAPYAPGVTGIAISMGDRERLMKNGKEYEHLGLIISECLAHNLLDARLDRKAKGETWMILYLNRMLCVRFKLPLQYGGWREKSLTELSKWMKKGYVTG